MGCLLLTQGRGEEKWAECSFESGGMEEPSQRPRWEKGWPGLRCRGRQVCCARRGQCARRHPLGFLWKCLLWQEKILSPWQPNVFFTNLSDFQGNNLRDARNG